MTIEWDDARMLFTPPLHSYECTVDATSPSPTAVRNVSVESFQALSLAEVRVSISWAPPLNVNGVLKAYNVCLSLTPLVNYQQQVPQCDHGTTVAVSLNYWQGLRAMQSIQGQRKQFWQSLPSPTHFFKNSQS